jgi:hypothetical protein
MLRNLRVRRTFSEGLIQAIPKAKSIAGEETISLDVLELIGNLNKLKKGVADLELDYDSAIGAIQKLVGLSPESLNFLELQSITYNVLYLLKNNEFSMRDYSVHAFTNILAALNLRLDHPSAKNLIALIERQLLIDLKIQDEMILKSILDCFRQLIGFFKN